MNMSHKKKETIKPFTINLSSEDYEMLQSNAKEREMEEDEYVIFLVRNDRPGLYTSEIASQLRLISKAVERFSYNDQKISQQCIEDIREGVNKLWKCF